MESLQHIISQKHELLARETFSRQTINYSEDMPADQKDRYIHYLIDKVNELDLDKRAMELAVEEFQGKYSVMRTLLTPYKLRTFAAKFNHLKFCDNVQQETDPETSVRGGEAY